MFLPLMAEAANPIQIENFKAGTSGWQLSNPAIFREIEGYASLTSVNRGGQINFFVSTTSASYTLEIFRMGWYAGVGGRRVHGPITRAGFVQPVPSPASVTRLVDCNWSNPYVLTVPNNSGDPTDWASGVYLVKLTAASGKQSYIIFVVRDDARPSHCLFQCSVTTYQAYNNWGGHSLYGVNSLNFDVARKISFNRPYAPSPRPNSAFAAGTGDFFCFVLPASYPSSSAGWECNMLRFLEREGYDVTYCTDVDTHANGNLLLAHRWFLSVGHDEYWSWQMRANVVAARDQGVNLGFFGANICVWQIRFEHSGVTGAPDRTIVAFKEASSSDPLATDGNPANDHLISKEWRLNPVAGPESLFIGLMYESDPVEGDIVIENASIWVCAGTGLVNGSRLPGLLGYEVDRMWGIEPPGTIRIAHSPYTFGGQTRFADMSTYTAASGATVFATGTLQWAWGLDDFNAPNLRPSRLNAAAMQMTRNVLARGAPVVQVPPPGPASNPSPGQNSTGVSLAPTLSWTSGSDATSHRVFFGTSPTLGGADLRATQSHTSYHPGALFGSTTYYWRIDEVNDQGTATGPVWNFTSAAAACPCVLPAAWWAAEGTAEDSAGGNHASLRNGAGFAGGLVGQAFSLDGIDDYVEIPDSAALRPANLTVEGWFNFAQTNSVREIASKALGPEWFNSWVIWMDQGVLHAHVGDRSGGGPILSHPTFRPVPGQWYHIAYTFDDAANFQALYINGVQGVSGVQNKTIEYDGHAVAIGADYDNGAYAGFLHGRADEVSIYARALGPAEIQAIYSIGTRGKDDAPPAITCPPNTTATCTTWHDPGVTGRATATDNCPQEPVVTFTDSAQGDLCLGTMIVTRVWKATDCSGRMASCAQLITVAKAPDGSRPTITCPPPVTAECGSDISPTALGTATATALCDPRPTVTFTDSVAPGPCDPAMLINRMWKATDCLGNMATCTQTITIPAASDSTPPSITCPPDLTAECGSSDPSATGFPLVTDNCHPAPVATFSDSERPGDCPNIKVIARAWTVADCRGNSTNCLQTITVRDTTAPVMSCPPALTVQCFGEVPAPNFDGGSAADNCGMQLLTHLGDVAQTNHPVVTITRAYRTTDPCGNTNDCTQIITVRDTMPPALTHPLSVTVPCQSSANPDVTGSAAAIDNCDPMPTVTFTDEVTGGPCPTPRVITRTWRATDGSGNSASTQQIITAADICLCSTGPGPIAGYWRADGNANDSGHANHGSLENGTTFAAGQVGQAFSLDGVDDYVRIPDSPTLRPASLTVEGWFNFAETNSVRVLASKPAGPGVFNSWVIWTENGVLRGHVGDASEGGPILSYPGFGPVPGQWYHIAFTFDDAADSQAFYVNGVLRASGGQPKSIRYDEQAVILGADFDGATAFGFFKGRMDEVSIYARVLSPGEIEANFNNNPMGRDYTPPVLTCPADTTAQCEVWTNLMVMGAARAIDNCDPNPTVTFSDSVAGGPCSPAMIVTRIWQATDCIGNRTTCTQIINVNVAAGHSPDLTCPGDVTVEYGSDISPAGTGTATAGARCGPVMLTHQDVETKAHDCGTDHIVRTIIRTWVAMDECTNMATCVQTIVVRDTTAPAVTCPPNLTVECGTPALPSVTGSVSATDNSDPSPMVTFADSEAGGPCPVQRVITRTWTATDYCGNRAICQQIITASGPPFMTSSKPVYFLGEAVMINFTNAAGLATDWIGLYSAGAPDTAFLQRLYTDGTSAGTAGLAHGSVNFAGGLAVAGEYEARLFFNDSYILQARVAFSEQEMVVTELRVKVARKAQGVAIEFEALAGEDYIVEASADLIHWVPVARVENAAGTRVLEQSITPKFPQRFYRLWRAP